MQKKLETYAALILREGVNVQPGQSVVINGPVQCREFVHILAQQAYKAGAGEAIVVWGDEILQRITLLGAQDEVLQSVPEWMVARNRHHIDRGACFISLTAGDPDAMQGVPAAKISTQSMAMRKAMAFYQSHLMNNHARWCVAAVPSLAWAKKVFPDMAADAAMDALWQAILTASRADAADPIQAWQRHTQGMIDHCALLNDLRFDALRIRSGNGTDLTVGLADDHLWMGGREHAGDGVMFSANIPSEEVFTAPHAMRVHGQVVSTKPLIHNGSRIENFTLTFDQGKVVDYTCETGADALKLLLDSDENARRLGEIALVPYNSPINRTNLLFYNTLFDENASCHLALGMAYGTCVGGEDRSDDALAGKGLNTSLVHIDFMIGDADTTIEGLHGEQATPVFAQGNWVI